MCGICGYIGPDSVTAEQLWKMNNSMYHRGPDDGGIWQERQEEGRETGLAQRRLSIMDLSEAGHQPMMSEDGRYIIVYNGEIYNFATLKTDLQTAGYHFRSNCDTEVLLYAFAEWGAECFGRLNGMFAVAVYDRTERKLTLARDRIGKKPLFYYAADGHFVFASELKPIMLYPHFAGKIDTEVLRQYFCNKYLAAPCSIFENTYKMVPGTFLEYQNGEIRQETYWDLVQRYEELAVRPHADYSDCGKAIDDLLQEAVGSRMVADVPVGTFLSGGIDSTLVTAIAQKNNDMPVRTYSIGFYDKERNEAPYAAEIAKFLGTDHHEHYVTEEDVLRLIEDLPRYYDEPFADSSQLPTMIVSQYAAQDITVVLSGDGGDELFCGYKMYDLTWVAQHADFMGNIAAHVPGISYFKEKMPAEIRAFLNNRDRTAKTQLFIDVMAEEVDKILGVQGGHVKFEQEKRLDMSDWQVRRMLLDMQTYLPDEVLMKTDRASMKYALEVRCPLLDYRVVEESFRIPQEYKYRRFDKKHILKDITYAYVPRELLDRPKKGFGVPLRKWLRTVLQDEVRRYADQTVLERQGIFVPEAVARLIQAQRRSDKIVYSSILWSFLVFQKWYQTYIEDMW